MKRINPENHGMFGTKDYWAWHNMKSRCYNKNCIGYKDYGGRGITICDEWINSFMAYYNDIRKLPNYMVKGYTLDRIDNDSGYFLSNVKYSTRSEQQFNRRNWGRSKYKGVSPYGNKYMAFTPKINGKRKYLGIFKTELEAHNAVISA